jgi:16S rRNA (guanine966-N2)-methyltransferase
MIGGKYRGKKISFPAIEGLRPTPDRVRETLFNWLMHNIHGVSCLDAFAGSGALGFEALSRHAGKVVMIEQSPKAYNNLVHLTKLFNASSLELIKGDACQHLSQTKEKYDIIFLDPPFAKDLISQCINAIEKNCPLVKDGFLYIESGKEELLNPIIWRQLKQKKSGQVFYSLYQKI